MSYLDPQRASERHARDRIGDQRESEWGGADERWGAWTDVAGQVTYPTGPEQSGHPYEASPGQDAFARYDTAAPYQPAAPYPPPARHARPDPDDDAGHRSGGYRQPYDAGYATDRRDAAGYEPRRSRRAGYEPSHQMPDGHAPDGYDADRYGSTGYAPDGYGSAGYGPDEQEPTRYAPGGYRAGDDWPTQHPIGGPEPGPHQPGGTGDPYRPDSGSRSPDSGPRSRPYPVGEPRESGIAAPTDPIGWAPITPEPPRSE